MTRDCGGQKLARKFAWILLPLWLLSLPGCALCIGGAIGAAAGYELHERGYKVRSPVQKAGNPTQKRPTS
jgi:hypothetical protein